jgi:hypothetical protein
MPDKLGISLRKLLAGEDPVGLKPDEAEVIRLYRSFPTDVSKRLGVQVA